jgi:D-xylose transport system substrate-binding protein
MAVDAILLRPIAITRDNLRLVIDAGWVSRATVCRGVGENPPAACR